MYSIFAFLTLWERVGLVVVEAQAVVVNTVVSNKIPKEIDIDGCGFLYLNKDLWVKLFTSEIPYWDKSKIDLEKFKIENNGIVGIYGK